MKKKKQAILELNNVLSKYDSILSTDEKEAILVARGHLERKNFGLKEMNEIAFTLLRILAKSEVLEQVAKILGN
ncbi:MAG: hypothetical protein ABJF04_03370 [Reichenbachiella sp.]|uniref:hypothetical protein n=1 Tax=Reichenbachiella sp. TaxID=2184521 RepID=UPI003264EB8E